MITVINVGALKEDTRAKIINITLDELWAALDEHSFGCSACTGVYLCPAGQTILRDIEPLQPGVVVEMVPATV